MVTRAQFETAAALAVQNVVKHGDTDIFPFPIENRAFADKSNDIVHLIVEYNDNFNDYITQFPPQHITSLTPVSYSGFRWVTQLDPIWNLHLLASVLSISDRMEAARLPKEQKFVFSYRYCPNHTTGDLFDRSFSWYQFMEHSLHLSNTYKFIIACDISEFYPRLGHHRLENALKQVAGNTPFPRQIISFLSNYSNTRSFGLPIGGPAARLLSEITINQVDHLLFRNGVPFVRFADDYHLFSDSQEDAFRQLIMLSEKLFDNQGLTLQKSKTRIMTSAEFQTTAPIPFDQQNASVEEHLTSTPEAFNRNRLLRFSLRFDPYSPTKEEDYARLKEEIQKFDIVGMLRDELAKSRIHNALAKK